MYILYFFIVITFSKRFRHDTGHGLNQINRQFFGHEKKKV